MSVTDSQNNQNAIFKGNTKNSIFLRKILNTKIYYLNIQIPIQIQIQFSTTARVVQVYCALAEEER